MLSFEFKGVTGVLAIIGLFLLSVFLVFVLPSMVATAVWNAIVFESLNGVKINLFQGCMLWSMAVIGLLLWLKPTFSFGSEDDLPQDASLFSGDEDLDERSSAPRQHSEHWKKWRKAAEDEKKAKSSQP
jgi:hypothetical protein